MRSVCMVRSKARRRRPGVFCGAIHGAAGAWTTTDPPLYPRPAREPPPERPRVAARDDRPDVGMVDRRAHDHRPGDPRPADGEADPLDAEPAAPRSADEGDPAEVQG